MRSSSGMPQKHEWNPRVLIASEKHGDRALDARTEQALHRSALFLLNERFADGWYYEPDPPPPIDLTERGQAVFNALKLYREEHE